MEAFLFKILSYLSALTKQYLNMETLKTLFGIIGFAVILFLFVVFAFWLILATRNLIKIYFDAWEERRK